MVTSPLCAAAEATANTHVVPCVADIMISIESDNAYLQQHQERLEVAMSSALSQTLHVQPDDPLTFCASRLSAQVCRVTTGGMESCEWRDVSCPLLSVCFVFYYA
jgi:hypothetical protein